MSLLSESVRLSKIAIRTTLAILAPFVIGLLANLVYVAVFLADWLRHLNWANTLPGIAVVVLFALGFPLLYFLLARFYAIRKGVELVYRGSSGLVAQVVRVVVNAAVKSTDAIDNGVFQGGEKGGVRRAGDFVRQATGRIPSPIRAILVFILEQLPLQHFLVEVSNEITLHPENLEEIYPRVQEKVDNFIINGLIGADPLFLWILALTNAIAMALCAWWLM